MINRSHSCFIFRYLTSLVLFSCVFANLSAQAELYNLDNITEVEITVTEEHWYQKLLTHKSNYVKKRVLASAKINNIQFDSIGIRFKGNSSFFSPLKDSLDKLPLNLKLSYKDKGQQYNDEYRTIKLSNVFRDPSYIRETLSYAIARTYVPAPQANYARVTVNGEYWGLYSLTQSIDEQFQLENYGSEEGILFKCDPSWEEKPAPACKRGDKANLQYLGDDSVCYADKYELKRSKKGWSQLIALTKQLATAPEELEKSFNVDEALWMLAFNNVLVNLDSYTGRLCHNYYLYLDEHNVWHPLLWDMNLSMGGFRFSGLGGRLDNAQLGNLSLFLHLKEKNQRRPLITKLLGIPLYRKMYVAHAKTIYEDYLKDRQYIKLADELRESIREEVMADKESLYAPETFDGNYESSVIVNGNQEIIGVQELMDARKAYFDNHPLVSAPTPKITTYTAIAGEEQTHISVTLAEDEPALQVWIYYRSAPHFPWQRAVLSGAGSSQFESDLPNEEIQEYYLVAEGKVTAQVLPARSAKEWLKVGVNEN